MLVLLQHGLLLLPPAGRAALHQLELGALAVTAFMALSGFIVAEALTSFYAGRPGAFLANRVLRVVPPYVVMLVLTVAMDAWLAARGLLVPLDAPLHGSPLQPRIMLAGLLEIVPGLPAHRVSHQDFTFIPFAWTLRVEFAFYLAAFAASVAMQGFQNPLCKRVFVGAAASTAYLVFAAFAWHNRHGPVQAGMLQLLCIPFFAFGVCIFFQLRRPGAWSLAHLFLVTACVPLAFTYWGQRGHPVLAFQLPFLLTLLAMLGALTRVKGVAPGARRWDRRLGELSYPLYIGHGTVLTALAGLSAHRGALPYLAMIPLSLLLAGLLHIATELPLRGLRARLRGALV
jgi:peptidoglycan/LPS O-acetylase OafA/YrhL